MSIRHLLNLLNLLLNLKLIVRSRQLLGWFVIRGDDWESWRRQWLLVIVSLGLFPVGLFFSRQFYRINRDYDSLTVVLLSATISLLILLFLMRLTRSHILPSQLLLAEMLLVLTFLVYKTGGLDSPALIWLSLTPIAAAVLIGLRTSLLIMGLAALDLFALHLLSRGSYPFPQAIPLSQVWWFQFLSTISFVAFVTLLLVAYEIIRQTSLTHLHKLSRAIENSPNMILIYDADGRIEYLNERFVRTSGYPREELIGTPRSALSDNELETHQRITESVMANGEWQGELLNRRAKGDPYWANVSISPTRDASGAVTHFVEIQEDISERKLAEEQIRLQSVALESAANAIVITERNGDIRWVNAAFTKLTGYRAEEVIGQNPRLLGSGEHDEAFYQDLWQTILSGRVWHSEITNRHKAGHLYTEEMTITPVSGAGGEITHFIAIKADVTVRKQAEAVARHRHRELTLLNRVITVAASELIPETVLATICRELALAFEVPQSGAALLNDAGTALRLVTLFLEGESSTGLDITFPIQSRAVLQSVLADKRPLSVIDTENDPRLTPLRDLLQQNTPVSLLLLPLVVREQVLGLVALGTTQTREFDEKEIALAGNAVATATQVLENARLFAAAQQNTSRLMDILEFSTDLAAVQEESVLLDTLVNRVAALADSPTCTLMLVDRTADEAELAAQFGLPKATPLGLRVPLTLEIIRQSLLMGEPMIVPDVDRDAPALRALLVRQDIGAFFAYPLSRRGQVLGFITLSSLTPRNPSKSEIAAYRLLSERAAAALENVRLVAQLQQRNLELNRLHRALGALFSGSMSGIENLAQNIVETIQREFEHSNCSLFLIEEGAAELRRVAAVGPYAAQLSQWSFPLTGRGLVSSAVRAGTILNVPDVETHPDYARGWHSTRSELTIPLRMDDGVIGAIDLQSAKPANFDLDDERLLAAFAERAALALQNARLFVESQRRTEELEALREASLHLTSTLDRQGVLTAILRYAIQLADARDAHVFLYDEENLSFGAALWVDGVDQQEAYTEPRPGGLTHTVACTGKRLVIPDVDSHPLFSEWRWGGAIIGLPLLVSGRTLGVMNIAFSEPRTFEESELRILDLLAAQAAVALENSRLFDETRRRAEELEAMLKVSSSLRTAQSQSDMIAIILDEVFHLLNAEGAALAMRDPVTGESKIDLARGAWSGVSGLRVPQGHPIAAQFVSGHELAVPISAADEKRMRGSAYLEEVKVAAYVPLIVQDEFIGAMWVGREEGITQGEVRLLTAISDFAANAIQRAKLYEQTASHAEELEQRVAERTNELSVANAELARANRAKDEFLANMSHELRTPLSNVLLRVEMLQEGIYGPLTDKQAHSLATIDDSGRHLLQLINDILDVSKIDAGKLELEKQLVMADSICQSSLQLIKEMTQQKHIDIHTDIQPVTLQADGRRLKQILVNLLTNAVKFTPDGGRIGLETILDIEKEVIHFVVWDTGVGIAAEAVSQLFVPFTQLESGLTRRYEGTGLGLALVRRLAEMHNGSVSVESELGRGSRFTVSLPWIPENADFSMQDLPEAEMQPSRIGVEPPVEQPTDAPATILLADDNEHMISGITDYLAPRGHRIIVARDGAEAIHKASSVNPDLILMDIQMPGMDGLEAIRRIVAANSRAVPIVALTALAMPGDRERCLQAGAREYLSKPVSLKKLAKVIAIHLEEMRKAETGAE